MKKLIVYSLIILTVVSTAACSSEPSNTESAQEAPKSIQQENRKAEPEGLTIGAFIGGAAPDEPAAKAFERGMQLAVAGKSPPPLKSTVLDRSQGAPNSAALQPLLSSVPLVVYWQTAELEPAAALLKQSGVISVPVWNVTEKVAALGTNVFGFGYSTERSFAQYAKYAGNKLKSYRFAVLSSSAEPFSTQSSAFIEETKSQGNTIVFEERVDSASADLQALVSRATKEGCDTIFAVLPGEALVALIKAARANSFPGKILVGDSFFAGEREALGKDAEGIYLLQSWSDDPSLKAEYSAKFGSDPDGITLGAAALGYDLVKCIEGVGSTPDARAIAYSWLSIPCEGLTGKTQFSGERIAQRVKRVLTVKGEKFELAAG